MQIVALRHTGRGYFVHVATGNRIKVRRITLGKIKLSQLASAMLNRSKLPNAELRKIPPTFWENRNRLW